MTQKLGKMLWSLGIILIIIAIFVLIFLAWWYREPSIDDINKTEDETNSNNYPTMHARCRKDPRCDGTVCVSDCGGDLICDTTCHRCKKKIGGNCSSTVDCETGLICDNWKCTPNSSSFDETPHQYSMTYINNDKKQVHWNEQNEIFQIPPRPFKSIFQ
jgi:hypothetical protein